LAFYISSTFSTVLADAVILVLQQKIALVQIHISLSMLPSDRYDGYHFLVKFLLGTIWCIEATAAAAAALNC